MWWSKNVHFSDATWGIFAQELQLLYLNLFFPTSGTCSHAVEKTFSSPLRSSAMKGVNTVSWAMCLPYSNFAFHTCSWCRYNAFQTFLQVILCMNTVKETNTLTTTTINAPWVVEYNIFNCLGICYCRFGPFFISACRRGLFGGFWCILLKPELIGETIRLRRK